MGKHKSSLQTHHLYLGAGGVLAVAALVVALTFGLSSAQTSGGSMTCGEGMTGTPPNCTSMCPSPQWYDYSTHACKSPEQTQTQQATCPTGMTGTPPNCQSTCPSPSYWDSATSSCKQPAATVGSCTAGQYWDAGTSTCKSSCASPSYWDSTTGSCKQPAATVGSCTSTQYWDAASSTCKPNAGTTTTTTCSAGQYWDAASSICKTSGTTAGTQCTGSQVMCPSLNNTCVEPSACAAATPVCAAGQQPTAANPCRSDSYQMSGTTGGDCWNSSSTAFATQACTQMRASMNTNTQTMRVCAVGEMPTTTNPCRMDSTTNMQNMPVCAAGQQPTAASPCRMDNYQPGQNTAGGDCWNSSSTAFATQACTQMRAQTNDARTNQNQQGNFRPCAAGETPTAANPCMPSGTGTQYNQGMMQPCGPNVYPTPQNPCRPSGDDGMMRNRGAADFSQPGQCGESMQVCPSPMNPANTMCMPKVFWAPDGTKKDPATCEDFRSQMQTGPGNMPFRGRGGMGGQGERGGFQFGQDSEGDNMGPMNPCEFNPNDPFCQAGFDFENIGDQFKFNQEEFDPMQYRVGNLKNEIKNLKREAKEWARDVKQIQRQLTELGRETSGFACPVAVEISAIVSEFESAVATVGALSDASTKEEVQAALALRDHVNGRYGPDGLEEEGLRTKLYGGPMDEDGNRVPGKMEQVGACQMISGTIQRACEESRNLSKELEMLKDKNASEDLVSEFEAVVAQVQNICANPLAALTAAGVSFDALTEPWEPDPDVCPMNRGPMYGPGPGRGHGGPGRGFEGPFPSDGGRGGQGGDFSGFKNMSPEMMERMMKKFKEMQAGGGDEGFGNPFGNSVLTVPSRFVAQLGDEFSEDEDFFGDEMPEECMPPVERYLGLSKLLRQLDPLRRKMFDHFESMNACEMISSAAEHFADSQENEDFKAPAGLADLIDEGVQACEDGDAETVERVREEMLNMGRGRGRGTGPRGRRGGITDLVDIDKLVEDKLAEKLAALNIGEGEETKELKKLLAQANSRLDELTNRLNEAQKTIFALNEQLSDLASRATAFDLNASSQTAIVNLSKFNDEEKMNSVVSNINEVYEQGDEVKDVLPPEADKLVDEVMQDLTQSPPSDAAVESINENFNILQSYAESGASEADIIEKAKDVLADIAVVNATDVQNKIADGIVGFEDTADLSAWYAVAALEAKEAGLISADLKLAKPAEPESFAALMVRACRLADIDFVEIKTAADANLVDMEKEIPGLPYWARGCVDELQERGEQIALNPPVAPIATADRGTVAEVFTAVLDLPVPSNIGDFLTPDVPATDPQAYAIAAMRETGCMDTVGTSGNFAKDVDFNRAQNMLVSTCLLHYGEEESNGSATAE